MSEQTKHYRLQLVPDRKSELIRPTFDDPRFLAKFTFVDSDTRKQELLEELERLKREIWRLLREHERVTREYNDVHRALLRIRQRKQKGNSATQSYDH